MGACPRTTATSGRAIGESLGASAATNAPSSGIFFGDFFWDGEGSVVFFFGDFSCAGVSLFLGDLLAAGDSSGAAAVSLDARLVERPVVMATTFSEVSTALASVLLRFAAAGFSAATGAADAALLRRLDVRVPAGTSGSSDGVEAVFATACRHGCARGEI